MVPGMAKLFFGSLLLVATMITGALLGSNHQPNGHVVVLRRTIDEPQLVPVPAPHGVASVPTPKGISPEASGGVQRVRRRGALSVEEARRVKEYDKEFHVRLREGSMAVTATLEAGPEAQLRAVLAMRAVRRERRDFLRGLLGRERYAAQYENEPTGGRDLVALLRELEEHGAEKEKDR